MCCLLPVARELAERAPLSPAGGPAPSPCPPPGPCPPGGDTGRSQPAHHPGHSGSNPPKHSRESPTHSSEPEDEKLLLTVDTWSMDALKE